MTDVPSVVPTRGILVGRSVPTELGEPAMSFDAALASLDRSASQGGLAGLPKPSGQAAAGFGQLGFFQAGAEPAPSPDRSSRANEEPDQLDADANADVDTGMVGLRPALDVPPPASDREGVIFAPGRAIVEPGEAGRPDGREADRQGQPTRPAGPEEPSLAAVGFGGRLPRNRGEGTAVRPTATASRSRPPETAGRAGPRVDLVSSAATSALTVAVSGTMIDDDEVATLGDAVRGLLARHGLVLGRLVINGRSAGTGSGRGGGE